MSVQKAFISPSNPHLPLCIYFQVLDATRSDMQLQFLLVILAGLFTQAFAIDLIEEGRKVIIQRDVEHILVKLDLSTTLDNLNSIGKSIFSAKRSLASNTLDLESDANLKPFFKQLDYLAKQREIRISAIAGIFVINQQENLNSRKRGLEILGDILSWGTGVPSARDHRQVLENLKLLRLDNNEMKSMLLQAQTQTRPFYVAYICTRAKLIAMLKLST